MQLVGITNIFTLICLGVLVNIAMQIQGHFMEYINKPRATYELKKPKSESTYVPVNWLPTIIGWILFLSQWIPMIAYFFAATLSSGVPWFVYMTFIGEFFNYASFGIVQVLYYAKKFIKSYLIQEHAYVMLSLFSKTYLALILAIAIAAR